MPAGELTFEVRRPPEIVFDFLTDLERAPEWASALASVTKLTAGEVGVGSRFAGRIELAGQLSEGEIRVVRFERPEAFGYAGSGGPAEFDAHFELARVEVGTLVRHRYGLKLKGFARMMEPVVRSLLETNAQKAVDTLRAAIEASAPEGR